MMPPRDMPPPLYAITACFASDICRRFAALRAMMMPTLMRLRAWREQTPRAAAAVCYAMARRGGAMLLCRHIVMRAGAPCCREMRHAAMPLF